MSLIFSYICIVTFILLVLCIAIDLVPIMKNWLGRIKLGKFNDIDKWRNAITHINTQWLLKTPKIKVTDNSRWIILDLLKGNYSSSTIQSWQEATLLLGINESLRYKEDKEFRKKQKLFLKQTLTSDGRWISKPQNIDGAILAYAIIQAENNNTNSYKLAMDEMWQVIQQHIGEDGTVMYRKSMKNYRYVDTIGFICPFLISYGVKYEKKECLDLAMNQIRSYLKYGILQEHFIPSHAYDINKKYPLGLYGWGRGLAWFSLGIIDSWNALPKHHPYKKELQSIIEHFAKTVLNLQQNNGSWNWTVTRNESRADSSTTAALLWFLLNVSQIPSISKECKAGIEKALHYLMKNTRRNGEIDFSQGDTKDIGVYSNEFTIMPFTQGLCVRSINYYLYHVPCLVKDREEEKEEKRLENNSIHSYI